MQSTKEKTTSAEVNGETRQSPKQNVSFFASVELAITLMALTAFTILVGAWCPQESQVGREKVFEAFGPEMGQNLIDWGVSDIFHSPWFLFLIAMLTVNMVAVSFQRVFPKVKLLKHAMPFLKGPEILRMPYARKICLDRSDSSPAVLSFVVNELARRRFNVKVEGTSATGEYGKYGRLAATITHIGLLTLLAGVTVTSWTGFSGFQPVRLNETMSMRSSQHSKLWIGKLPDWSVRVDATRRENYPTGEAKQWYSTLAIVDPKGNVLKKGEISVNNPLSYDGVDIYQSSWGLDSIDLSFNNHNENLPLQPMGNRHAAFMPLDQATVMIFSVIDQSSPLRLFAKRTEWDAPKMIAEVKPQSSVKLGNVEVRFDRVIPATGLQYKCDPGIPIVYTAFAFIIVGVMLAAIPHRHVWVAVQEETTRSVPDTHACPSPAGDQDLADDERQLENSGNLVLYIGGTSRKARVGFEKLVNQVAESVEEFDKEQLSTEKVGRSAAHV